MSRNRSSRRRRRGGQRQNQEAAQAPATPAPAEPASPAPAPARPQPPQGGERQRQSQSRESGESRGGRPDKGPRRGGDGGRGGQGRNRRRGPRRPHLTIPTGAVFKKNAPVAPRAELRAMNDLARISTDGEPVFGCPLLTRSKLGLPTFGGEHAPRCTLGWSIHSEQEVAYCLATPDHTQCWKANPERLDELQAEQERTAAD